MKRIKKIALLTIPVAVLLTLVSCGGRTGPAPQTGEKITPVTITHPVSHNIERTVRFTGSLKGSREVMVYPPLPGKFMGYAVSEGGYVSKGSTVGKVDRDIPGVSYEPVPIEAPISGRFFSLGISQGEMVAPQVPIGRISETGLLKLEFNIPEKYIASVNQGSTADLYVPTLDYRTRATLSRVSRFVDSRSGSAQAEASVSNPSNKLAPGMFAEIDVVVASKKANLALPIDCVLGLDGKFVYVVIDRGTEVIEGDTVEVGKAVKRDIKTGLEDSEYIEIVSGLSPDDEVLYIGQRIVEEGGKVKIVGTYRSEENEK